MNNIKDTIQCKWFEEVWNKGNEKMIEELLTADAVAHGLRQQPGTEGFRNFYRDFKSRFSNINIHLEDVIVQDNIEISRCKVKLTETATGKEAEFSGACITRIENGKIAEGWNYFDFFSMYQQLGYSLTPPAA